MDRNEWLEARRTGIGSSDAAAVCGLSPYAGPLEVYLDKIGALPPRDSQAMTWGRRLEDVVALAYQERTGRTVLPPPEAIVRHPVHSWLLASLDRVTECGRILECKTARTAEGWGPEGTDLVPEGYLIQVQHQLLASGRSRADLAVLIGGQELRVYELEADERIHWTLEKIEGLFWGRVEARNPPPLDWQHPDAPRLVELLYRPREGVEIELDASALVLADQYRLLGDSVAQLERQRDEVKVRLVQAMGEAQVGRLPDGRRVQRRVVPATEVKYTRREYCDFRLLNPKKEKTHGATA